MPTGREGLGATTNGSGGSYIYAIGGYNNGGSYSNTVESYFPYLDDWISRASMPTARRNLGVVGVNGKIYAIGGYNGSYLNKVEEYDPETNSWTVKSPMPTARYNLGVAAVNGKIYAIGGYNNGYLNKVEEYDPATATWVEKAPMPIARSSFGLAAVNGKIYAIGGTTDGNTALNIVQEYDPATNTWSTKANMPTERFGLEAVAINNKIYAIGGFNLTSFFTSKLEEYNPITDNWEQKSNMLSARSQFGAAVSGGRIYVFGGTGCNPYSVEQYTPPFPTNILTTSTGYKINISWGNVSGATSYEIEADGVVYNTGTDTSFSHNNLTPQSLHLYRLRVIKVYDTVGGTVTETSDWSSIFGAMTWPDDYGDDISAATPITFGTEKNGTINYGEDVDFFKFTPATSGEFIFETTGNTDTYGHLYNNSGIQIAYNDDDGEASNFKIAANLSSGETYYIKIRHNSSIGTGSYVFKVHQRLNVPSNVTLAIFDNTAVLSWDPVDGATKYAVKIDDGIHKSPSGQTYTIYYTSSGENSYIFNISSNMGYAYSVRAENDNSMSDWSPWVFGTTKDSIWSLKSGMNTPRHDFGIAAVNGKIYVIGGSNNGSCLNTVEEYDPITDTWSYKAPMPTARRDLSVAVIDGKIFAIGGFGSSYLNVVEIYDPQTNSWSTGSPMPVARYGHGLAAVSGKIYAIGGYNGSFMNRVDEFDPTTNTWTLKSNMPTPRVDFGVSVIADKIYAIGGYNGSALNVVEEYDLSTDTWKTKAPMITARYCLSATSVGDIIIAAGGISNAQCKDVEVYDPVSNTWDAMQDMLVGSYELGLISLNDKLYAIGGYSDIYDSLNIVQEFSLKEEISYMANYESGVVFDLVLSAANIRDFNKTFTLKYSPSEVEMVDFVEDEGIILLEQTNGRIIFKINKIIPVDKIWTGTVFVVRFKSINTGGTKISLETGTI